jgi:disulfide bond formation protein DsbB|tara:strand:- start:1513 stop:2019 length:507 start_codon:yes stop_codon:yes gene_type:complete
LFIFYLNTMVQISNKSIFQLIIVLSILVLLAAYFIEFILGHKPCNLCLIERIPYFVSIVLCFFAILFKKFEKLVYLVLSLFFLFGAIVSFYHLGIEQGFFQESSVCNLSSDSLSLSREDLLKKMNKEIISCKDVSFRIFGLSLATINTFLSLIISTILLNKFIKYGKN